MELEKAERTVQSLPLALRNFQKIVGGMEELILELSRSSWRQWEGLVGRAKVE